MGDGDAAGVSFAPVVLARDIADRHGVLGHVDGALAVVLVRLDDEAHGPLRGHWAVEVGFGRWDVARAPTFASLGAAAAWLTGHTKAAC